jgi:tRNA pseudouridine55 synthase
MQQPPAFSAKRIDGHRSYDLARARAGRRAPAILPHPVEVTAHAIDILGVSGDDITLQVTCSAGFYLRSLAHDLGERLGTGAHLIGLRRTRSGDFALGDSVALDAVELDPEGGKAALVPRARMLLSMSSVVLTAEGAKHAAHGQVLEAADLVPGLQQSATWTPAPAPADAAGRSNPPWIRLLDQNGDLVGLARREDASGVLHPSVVLV